MNQNQFNKLVSNARAIISNQISIPLGILKMERIIFGINQIGKNEKLETIDLRVFSEYNSKTINFAIGSERLKCSKEFLIEQDKLLDQLTSKYKEKLLNKCFEIIEEFNDTKNME